jgi:intracellular septation protein
MWVVFFLVAGALNIFVAYRFDEATWVNFKLFGLMGLTLLFALAQGVWIAQKTEASASSETQ